MSARGVLGVKSAVQPLYLLKLHAKVVCRDADEQACAVGSCFVDMPITATFHGPPVLKQRREALDAWSEDGGPSGLPQPVVYVGVNRMLLHEGAKLDSEVLDVAFRRF